MRKLISLTGIIAFSLVLTSFDPKEEPKREPLFTFSGSEVIYSDVEYLCH